MPLTLVGVALSDRTSADGHTSITLSGWRLLIAAAVMLGYYFISESLTTTSPGKRLMGLAVVDSSDARPTPGKVAGRTAMRLVDALPAFYLVGFIVMLSSPSKQRVGDMVAKTKVVRIAGVGEQSPTAVARSARSSVLLSLVAALTLAGGVVGIVLHGDDSGGGKVKYSGLLVGDYRIDSHRLFWNATVTELKRTLDILQVHVLADFEKGRSDVRLFIADIDGSLRLIRWDIQLLTS